MKLSLAILGIGIGALSAACPGHAQSSGPRSLSSYLKPAFPADPPRVQSTRSSLSRDVYVGRVGASVAAAGSAVTALSAKKYPYIAAGAAVATPLAQQGAMELAGHAYDHSGGAYVSAPRSMSVRTTTPYMYRAPNHHHR